MEIIDGKALKLTLRNPYKILNVIPKSALLEEGDEGGREKQDGNVSLLMTR